MKNNLDIILGIAALIVFAYRAFRIEASIYDAIEDLKQSINNRIAANEMSLGIHVAIYKERKERIDYLIHALDEKIDHKANRFTGELKDLEVELRSKLKSNEV